MQANSRHGNYSSFICSSESEKCAKEGGKLQEFKYIESEKVFLDE